MSDKLKIIFLDIDGVIRPFPKKGESNYPYGESDRYPYNMEIDRCCVERVKQIINETGAKLVISSTWGRQLKHQAVLVALASNGLNGPYVLPQDVGEEEKVRDLYRDEDKLWGVAFTRKKMSSEKSHEIGFWLSDYSKYIDSYIILDDNDIYPDYEEFKERNRRHVKTNGNTGIIDDDVKEAINLLNEKI